MGVKKIEQIVAAPPGWCLTADGGWDYDIAVFALVRDDEGEQCVVGFFVDADGRMCCAPVDARYGRRRRLWSIATISLRMNSRI